MASCCGHLHSAAVTEDGSLWTWGQGMQGELGLGKIDKTEPTCLHKVVRVGDRVVMVSAGLQHTAFLVASGVLWTYGRGNHGQLGLGDRRNRSRPTMVGRGAFGGAQMLMVSCGRFHTAAVTIDGSVWTYGRGSYAVLGHADRLDQLVPRRVAAESLPRTIVMVAAACRHTLALSAEGQVFSWGSGEHGKLGHGDYFDKLVPVPLRGEQFGGSKVVFVSAAGVRSLAVTEDGKIYTWGKSNLLGNRDIIHGAALTPAPISTSTATEQAFGGAKIVMASASTTHVLVVTADGALWAFGQGRFGQLGLDDKKARCEPTRVGAKEFCGLKVVCAAASYTGNQSLAVTDDGGLWAWGEGNTLTLSSRGEGNTLTLSSSDADERHTSAAGSIEVMNRCIPTRVASARFQEHKVGRCRALASELALAFAMCTHSCLAGSSSSLGASAAVQAMPQPQLMPTLMPTPSAPCAVSWVLDSCKSVSQELSAPGAAVSGSALDGEAAGAPDVCADAVAAPASSARILTSSAASACVCGCKVLPIELVDEVLKESWSWPEGIYGREEAFVRLVGGFALWRRAGAWGM